MRASDAVSGPILIAIGLALFAYARTLPEMPGQDYGPGVFPGLIGIGLAVCGGILLARGARTWGTAAAFALDPALRTARGVVGLLSVVAAAVFYILVSDWLGFFLTAPITLGVVLAAFRVRPLALVAVSLAATLAIHFAFYSLLRVPLPWGILEPYAY